MLQSFLEHAAYTLQLMAYSQPARVRLDPRVAIACFTSVSVAVALSEGLVPPLIALAALPLLIALLGASAQAVARVVGLTAGFATAVTAPMVLYSLAANGLSGAQLEPLVLRELAPLVARSGAAAGYLALMVCALGPAGLVKGLAALGIPRSLALMLTILLSFIPVALRDVARLLSAREARMLAGGAGYRRAWTALSSTVGELLARELDRAWRVHLAMKARHVDHALLTGASPARPSRADAALAAFTLALLALMLVARPG